ncbi:amidase [Pendulispora albinea]|uniref:Amidase n=2 Tax=Pendulispora albinea TaxID=2741071 RepID=A0ABZ2MAA9_9BACT
MTSNESSRDAAGSFAHLSIAALGRGYRKGTFTARKVVSAAIAAARRLNPSLNAFVSIDEAGALEAADRADLELGQGLDRGPLHGVPVAIKDIIDIAGQVTTSGSAVYQNRIAERDAAVITRLREAGAVLLGKTVMHEFAFGITGDKSVHGPSRNPHDPTRLSGGSSGGSAVAVSAGIVPLALGTDTAGSVRVPAALCGAFGYKPAFGTLPTGGVGDLAPSLDHVGIFTHDPDDVRIAMEVLTGASYDTGDVPRDMRIAWIDPESFGPIDPAVANRARVFLDGAGVAVDRLFLDGVDALFAPFTDIEYSEAYVVHRAEFRGLAGRIDAGVLQRLEGGGAIPAWRLIEAQQRRTALTAQVRELLGGHPLLALPTATMTAPLFGVDSVAVGGRWVQLRPSLLSLTSLWNLAGFPALSVPAGRVAGLPVGLQLVAAPGSEALIFALARKLSSQTAAQEGAHS